MESINYINGKVIKITCFVQWAAVGKNLDVKFQPSWVAVLPGQQKKSFGFFFKFLQNLVAKNVEILSILNISRSEISYILT